MKVIFILLCMVAGGVSAYYGQPYARENTDLVSIIVTVITVFAGFLIAIITIIGDPVMIPNGSWRLAEGGRDRMEQRLYQHVALFSFYLITIALLFVGVILDKALAKGSVWSIWIERGYIFFGVTSFLLTFALPITLLDLQRARYDSETERRRRAAGIRDDDK